MKHFFLLLLSVLTISVSLQAQTYMDRLKQNAPGKGSVTVHQSKELDELVNGKTTQQPGTQKPAAYQQDSRKTPAYQQDSRKAPDDKAAKANTTQKTTPDSTKKKPAEHHDAAASSQHESATHKTESEDKADSEQTPVDLRKKVMKGSYKVTGYRVQAYAGGNSRADRQKAEQIGNAIKMKYPEQPIYVHFYSPRWICRVGNFRSLQEANAMLAKVRAMGYKQACLVKGKITVQ